MERETMEQMTVEAAGTFLSREAALKGWSVVQTGSLFVHVTRHGCDWALELCDERAIVPDVAHHWAAEVGAPTGTMWRSEAHGRVWRCEWTGTEDPAPAGSKTTWIGGR